jgi:hypothetical protein
MRRRSWVCLVANRKAIAVLTAMAAIFAASPAFADVRVSINEDVFEKEVSPLQQDHNNTFNFTLSLTGKNDAHYTCSDGCNYDIKLGRTIRNEKYGSETTYLVRNGSIIIELNTSSYSAVTTIKTNGVTSCSAVTRISLKPGHQYFELYRISNHEKMYNSIYRITITSCSISSS